MRYKFTPEYLDNESNLILKIDILSEIVSFFECHQCTVCCKKSSPNLLSDEYKNFHKNRPKDEIYWKDDNRVQIKGNPCPFLDNDCCKIHDNKPRLCRIFPFIASQNSDCVFIYDCKLGREILEEYFKFLDDTDRKADIDFDVECTLSSYFTFDTNMLNIAYFSFWLKKRNKEKKTKE